MLGASDDCFDMGDVEWISRRATLRKTITILDIEQAVLRTIAIRATESLRGAAKLLGISAGSLDLWMMRRRKNDLL
jgi:hypothetical protein